MNEDNNKKDYIATPRIVIVQQQISSTWGERLFHRNNSIGKHKSKQKTKRKARLLTVATEQAEKEKEIAPEKTKDTRRARVLRGRNRE